MRTSVESQDIEALFGLGKAAELFLDYQKILAEDLRVVDDPLLQVLALSYPNIAESRFREWFEAFCVLINEIHALNIASLWSEHQSHV